MIIFLLPWRYIVPSFPLSPSLILSISLSLSLSLSLSHTHTHTTHTHTPNTSSSLGKCRSTHFCACKRLLWMYIGAIHVDSGFFSCMHHCGCAPALPVDFTNVFPSQTDMRQVTRATPGLIAGVLKDFVPLQLCMISVKHRATRGETASPSCERAREYCM